MLLNLPIVSLPALLERKIGGSKLSQNERTMKNEVLNIFMSIVQAHVSVLFEANCRNADHKLIKCLLIFLASETGEGVHLVNFVVDNIENLVVFFFQIHAICDYK
jgi:hypothetical protein